MLQHFNLPLMLQHFNATTFQFTSDATTFQFTSDATTFQITSDATTFLRQRVVISDTLDSNLLIVLLMIIRLCTHLSPTISSDTATLHVCKQPEIASGNNLFLVIL